MSSHPQVHEISCTRSRPKHLEAKGGKTGSREQPQGSLHCKTTAGSNDKAHLVRAAEGAREAGLLRGHQRERRRHRAQARRRQQVVRVPEQATSVQSAVTWLVG